MFSNSFTEILEIFPQQRCSLSIFCCFLFPVCSKSTTTVYFHCVKINTFSFSTSHTLMRAHVWVWVGDISAFRTKGGIILKCRYGNKWWDNTGGSTYWEVSQRDLWCTNRLCTRGRKGWNGDERRAPFLWKVSCFRLFYLHRFFWECRKYLHVQRIPPNLPPVSRLQRSKWTLVTTFLPLFYILSKNVLLKTRKCPNLCWLNRKTETHTNQPLNEIHTRYALFIWTLHA